MSNYYDLVAGDSVTIEKSANKEEALVLWFDEVTVDEVHLVGGKNSSLGEMIQSLTPKGVRVPHGFATTAHAYRVFIKENDLEPKLRALFKDLDVSDTKKLAEVGRKARQLILRTPFPDALNEAILKAYATLARRYGCDQPILDVAVRSSATAEDLPDASFAGQQETYLNVLGEESLLDSCHRCFASLFTNRAISYRTIKKFDHFDVALSVGVQKMVRSDLASAGVAFSIDTESGFRDAALITASWGLGESVVQGTVSPDEYLVHKPTLAKNFKPIIEKNLGSKQMQMVYDMSGGKLTKSIPVAIGKQKKFCLTDEEVLGLARWVVIIEKHYSERRGAYTPMDIEFAKDGHTGDLFIVQARPETVISQQNKSQIVDYSLTGDSSKANVLAVGRSVGKMIGQGKASVIHNVTDINTFVPGTVLVTSRTDPDWEPIMKQASGIVTDQGGRTCHAAIISRELGIPSVVGTGNGTTTIQQGEDITVCCAQGENGYVYQGSIPFERNTTDIEGLPKTQTKILLNIGNPSEALQNSFLPVEGVGLTRMEFMIASHIGVHPLALLHPEKVQDAQEKQKIAELTAGYDDKAQYFVEKLARGISLIAAAFYPKPVIVRMSDFKTNEYANLCGGAPFEPTEANPMIGWRGASRYYDSDYREGFALECAAMKNVREVMGFENVIPMIPFCRTPSEADQVIAEMSKNGLKRGENGLQVYMMCEIPANVILAEEFAKRFDGFSIGSNDLTQLVLGLDRDSEKVSHLYDERNEAVKGMIRNVIKTCKATKTKIGICGQAPSDFPEFAAFLIEEGIDSMSLSADTVVDTLVRVAKQEKELGRV